MRGAKLFNRYEDQPEPGATLRTTIDIEFQEYFYNRMKEGLETLDRDSGVGIALNPRTGEILALMSFQATTITSLLCPVKIVNVRHF